MAPNRCQYINCTNTNETHSLFRFPVEDKNRLRMWINNSGNINLTTLLPEQQRARHLCETHFDACYKYKSGHRTLLANTAIPRHFHCEDESIDVISSVPINHKLQEVEVTPESSPRTLKVLTPQHVYRKRTFHVMEAQEDSSSVSSQFNIECEMPSPKKQKRGGDCSNTQCIERKRLLQLTTKTLKNKKAQIIRLKKKIETGNSIPQHTFPSGSSRLMAMMQMRPKKCKWTKEERRLALGIFYKSPACYNFLRDQGIVLPTTKAVKRWLSESDCLPGLAKNTFRKINQRFESASLQEKACVLTFDEMSIMTCLDYNKKHDFIEGYEDFRRGERTQKLAKHVLVFLARGIYSSWKIPLCYFLSSSNVKAQKLQLLVKVILNKLFHVGLLPKVTVCDQVSTNQSVMKNFGASKDHPFFFVNDKKIFSVFDVPHCIKNLRNNWLTNNLVYKDKELSFKDIVATYEIDKKNKSRTLLKITPNHLCPNSFQKMKVKLATQVFSHSVSAAINTALLTGELESPTASDTAEFILIINDMFDALNSRCKYDKNPSKCGLTQNNAAMQSLKKGLVVLKDLKKVNIKGNTKKLSTPPSFEGLQQSCVAIMQLLDEENSEGIEYLLTNRLNQDVLENLFSIYRLKGGNNKNPSARVLRSIFRSYLSEMLTRLSGHQNCESVAEELQMDATYNPALNDHETGKERYTNKNTESDTSSSRPEGQSPEPQPEQSTSGKTVSAGAQPSTSDQVPSLEQCSVTYFAGWLAKRCHDQYKCDNCFQIMTKNVDLNDKKQLLIMEKTYGSRENSKLKCPSDVFYRMVDACLVSYNTHFDVIKHKLGVKKNLLNHLTSILNTEFEATFVLLCREHIVYVLEKLIITKICFYCKSYKRNIVQNQQKLRLLQNK